jgi:drug/metabolite transporter (DMT)-like permease
VLFVLYTAMLFLAVGWVDDRAQALEIGLLNYLWPAMTLVLSLVLLKRRARVWLVPGTLTALAGVFLVMTQGASVSWASVVAHVLGNPAAYLLAFLAAITWALYSNLARLWGGQAQTGAVGLFIPVTGLVLVVLRLMSPEVSTWSVTAAGEVGLLGGITALAYVLWEKAMRQGNLVLVVICSYFTPLFSTLLSCLYLKVNPGPKLWLGCGLLVIGSLISGWSTWNPERSSRAERIR